MTKTLLVGFDAACWEYVEPLLEQNELPNLQGLIDSGVSATLHSTMPPWTPTAWSSLITGLHPNKHRIFDMLRHDLQSGEFIPVTASQRQGTPFWEYLNREGVRVGLVNIPFIYPLDNVNGFAIYGFGTPNNVAEYGLPEEAMETIFELWPEWKPKVDYEVYLRGSGDEVFAVEVDLQHRRMQAAVVLAEKYEVDVLAINLMLLDHINHRSPDMDMVNKAMIQTDEHLGRLLTGYSADNIMLISDHGANRVRGEFWFYSWLQEEGYFAFLPRDEADRQATFNWIIRQWLVSAYSLNGVVEKATRAVLRNTFNSLPKGWQQRLWAEIEKVIPEAKKLLEWTKTFDTQTSRLLPGTIYSGLLYSNPNYQGELDAGWEDDLVANIEGFIDPVTGEAIFSAVHVEEDTEFGKRLILDSFDSQWLIRLHPADPEPRTKHNGYFVEPPSDFGWHSRDGLLVFAGDRFTQGNAPGDFYLPDVPTTLLHLHQVPIPDSFDGQVMEPLLAKDFLSKNPVRFQSGDDISEQRFTDNVISPEESQELIAHLRGLGYLD